MDKRHVTLAVSCLLLLGLAGTAAGAGYCAAAPDGAGFPPEDTAGSVTGDNSCTACLDQCSTRYPASGYPVTNWFCRFSCWSGSCRIPPVFEANLPNP